MACVISKICRSLQLENVQGKRSEEKQNERMGRGQRRKEWVGKNVMHCVCARECSADSSVRVIACVFSV